MIIIISILSALLIIAIFIISNLNRQVKTYEDFLKGFDQKEKFLYDEIEKYYQVLLGIFTEAYSTMQKVDQRGAFSSDDEVGFSFKIIFGCIEDIKHKLINLRKTQEDE